MFAAKSCKIQRMHITINGSQENYPTDTAVSQLLNQLNLQDKRIALEINKEIIPRSEYDQHILNDGDIVEIIHAIGGG